MLALLGLCYWVISQESTLQRHGYKSERLGAPGASYSSTSTSGAGIWTFVFAYYCLLIHILVFLFPLRACWSVWDITQSLRRSAQSKPLDSFKMGLRRRGSSTSISSAETLTSDTLTSDSNAYSSTVSEASDVEPEPYTDSADSAQEPVIHAIIIPNYKEEMDTLKETLEVLASHPQAYLSYDVSPTLNRLTAGCAARDGLLNLARQRGYVFCASCSLGRGLLTRCTRSTSAWNSVRPTVNQRPWP